MATKHSSIVLASEGSFDTTSTDSLSEMRSLVAEYAEDPSGAVLDGWEPREGTIITEVRAISARINQNYDAWPSEELREAHHTFIGKPVFVNHNNHDPDRARGRVVASRYVDAGEEDRYVQVLQEVEASRFPMLAKELMEGGLDSVSMGAEAREVECSYCSNISTSPFDACEHIPLKGSYLQRRTASGTPEDILVYEICRKISFFELSYVFDPADETAVASNVLVANRHGLNSVEVPPKVDTLHPDEDEKSQDDWQEFVDDPNVIDTIDVLDEPDLGLNQELERVDDELPEGFEEFSDVDDRIEENEQAEKELAQDAREKSQEKADEKAEKAQQQFEQAEPDPEDDKSWEDEDDGAGGTSSRFKGGGIEALVADDYGTFNMWVEKNGSLIASDTYLTLAEAKEAAIAVAKEHRAKTSKESKMSRVATRKRSSQNTAYEKARRMTAAPLEGWDTASGASAIFQERDFQLWVATDDYDDGTENWQKGEWSVFDSTFSEVASGSSGSVNSAVWDALSAAEGEGFDTSSVPASGNTNASRKVSAQAFTEWMSTAYPGKELLDFKRPEQSRILNEYIQEVGEGNEVWSSRRKIAQWEHAHPEEVGDPSAVAAWKYEDPAFAGADAAVREYEDGTFDYIIVGWDDDILADGSARSLEEAQNKVEDFLMGQAADQGLLGRRNGGRRTSRMKNRDTSRRSNRMAPQRRRRIGDNNKQTPLLEETGIAQTPAPEPVALPEEGDSVANSSESDRVKSARRALAREMARDRARKARRRTANYSDMSDFDLIEMHGELENELMDGSDDESRVIRDMNGIQDEADKRGLDLYDPNFDPNERAFMSRRRRAKAVGQDLSGASVKREDLFQDYPATTMTAQLRKRFAAWVQENYGASLRQASGPGELRSWARAFSREAGIDLPRLHAAIKRDVQALRTAEDKDDNDIPDFIEEKIEDSKDDDDDAKEARRKAARRAVARRRAMQARNARGRRTQTTRRRTADEKLDLAAPGDRVNVEKPTSGTTDADAEASQFDKADFDNNSGKGLENPDTTPTAGTPGGPSVNDLKKTSRATGLQAVRLAEAMIAAGLIEDSTESKFKAAAQFEKMSRDIVLDRTALLEKVATVHAKRRSSATKSAGNRGTSLNSAVPPNMAGAARSSAPQTREAASANDSDLFF